MKGLRQTRASSRSAATLGCAAAVALGCCLTAPLAHAQVTSPEVPATIPPDPAELISKPPPPPPEPKEKEKGSLRTGASKTRTRKRVSIKDERDR